MKFERSSGILLHISSLSGNFGIGSMGNGAKFFIDFLQKAAQKLWQICPLGPTGYGNSPYQTYSAFAGNPLFIDLEELMREGFINETDLQTNDIFIEKKVEFEKVTSFKSDLFRKAYRKFLQNIPREFTEFCRLESDWLEDYSLFMALKKHFDGKAWNRWDEEIKLRKSAALKHYSEILRDEIFFHKFLQFVFFKQWNKIHDYCLSRNIKIIGDIPIYVAFDSADAWSHPEYFLFDEENNPTFVAGVPPDEFSPTGQLWGNPLYNWKKHQENNFSWWVKRFRKTLEIVDILRIDHFIGFVNFWAVPAKNKTAENGSWQPAPGKELFATIKKETGNLPIIAEDLGAVTQEVIDLRNQFDFPGMKILHFAFGTGKDNPYLPENFPENCVVYTGTHDNETTEGWFRNLPEFLQKEVDNYLPSTDKKISWRLLEAAWKSRADFAIAPMQDFLGLDNSARMNTPGTIGGNWEWRVKQSQLTDELAARIRKLTLESER